MRRGGPRDESRGPPRASLRFSSVLSDERNSENRSSLKTHPSVDEDNLLRQGHTSPGEGGTPFGSGQRSCLGRCKSSQMRTTNLERRQKEARMRPVTSPVARPSNPEGREGTSLQPSHWQGQAFQRTGLKHLLWIFSAKCCMNS